MSEPPNAADSPPSPSSPEQAEITGARSVDLVALAPGLGDTCAEYLNRYRTRMEQQILAGRSGIWVSSEFAKSVDGLLSALGCAASAAIGRAHAGPPPLVSVLGVGGYGRGRLALHSDLDVLFLARNPEDPRIDTYAQALLYPIWDLGLSVGHAVRGLDETLELARRDIRTATTLLDVRWVVGGRGVADELLRGARRKVFEPALNEFLDALQSDTERRHERFGASVYLLEPDVKFGLGGLRDLDVARWAAKARWNTQTIDDYVRTGALLPREIEEIGQAEEMLWRVRNLLHLRAGRRQDRLTFSDQEEIAEQLGFVDGVTLGVEQFMQAYYRHARVIALHTERMLERVRPPRKLLSSHREAMADGTLKFQGYLTLQDSKSLRSDPALALRFFAGVVRHQLPPYPYARNAIARIAEEPEWAERLRSRDAGALFCSLVANPKEAPVRRGSVLGELHQCGLLLAMVPEFAPLMGRVQHDDYHVYTVDVHAVRAVDRLHQLMRGAMKQEHSLACRLASEAPRRTPLVLATLLRDLGKVHGTRGSSERGAKASVSVTERLGLSLSNRHHVAWLIEHQMDLYHWATRRDTTDPTTVSELAGMVGSLDRLRDLYLLTVASVSTTNPKAMTSWNARMLEDLYLTLAAAIEGDGSPASAPSRAERAEEVRAEVRESSIVKLGSSEVDELDLFLRQMPDRYLLSNPVSAIESHAGIAAARGGDVVKVGLLPVDTDELSELVVVADDRPGILGEITAVLSAHRLSVVTAQIYTRQNRVAGKPVFDTSSREAFDVFHVRRPGRVEPVDDALAKRIEADLRRLFAGEIEIDSLIERIDRRAPRHQRHLPEVTTNVIVDNAVSKIFTVVEVFTRDRIGLLCFLARTLGDLGLSIALAKVSTEGARALDVFYLENSTGGRVTDPARLTELADRLTAALVSYQDSHPAGSDGA